MQKNKQFVDVFTNLEHFPLSTDTFYVLEEFTCPLCGHIQQNDVHEVIKLHFEKKTKLKCNERPLGNIKSVETTTFPPFRSVLTQDIKRAWYIAKLYKPASETCPMNELTRIDYGWKLLEVSNLLIVTCFEGQQVPQEIEDVQAQDESDDEAMEYDSDKEENGRGIEN